ncbi:hypothetical protein [Dethiobacter alkaliphilus]|uniref:DUF4829 domain-containing protein n=1 Tax=Dethiobacter alkaliphilus AHT 1 TaxID=555088 RepID=C0GEU1_DETAL|nr:hypothetical protein [Dethiobacter alkaliphilus]EEG78123.1 hypothetical protein DealDRAFT_1000 [Dethiobacter alkaliphilus AHT 1]
MSKKKIFALICLFIFTAWGIVSLYYYNKHLVTIKEYKMGERIEVSEGTVIINSIEIHDFERQYLGSDRIDWFYNSFLPKVPVSLQRSAVRVMAFYSEPYNSDLGVNDTEGRMMYVYGIYIPNDGKGLLDDDMELAVSANVITENGRNLTLSSGGYLNQNTNYILFHSGGRFFLNEYSLTSDDSLIIRVEDKLSEENHEIVTEPVWETKKYNFFSRPPAEYSFSPGTAFRYIGDIIRQEDVNAVDGLIHPQINDFPWEHLEHYESSGKHGGITSKGTTQYIDSYLGFADVFSTRITFSGSDDENADTVFEQHIYVVNYDGEWKIIDVSPPTTTNLPE